MNSPKAVPEHNFLSKIQLQVRLPTPSTILTRTHNYLNRTSISRHHSRKQVPEHPKHTQTLSHNALHQAFGFCRHSRCYYASVDSRLTYYPLG